MKAIQLGPDLKVSVEAATDATALLGQRGSGKSNGAGVFAEGMLDAGVQMVIIDQTSAHWGLRLKADGKTPSGYEIIVLGGQHGDAPAYRVGVARPLDAAVARGRAQMPRHPGSVASGFGAARGA